jgi:hypothetical protein
MKTGYSCKVICAFFIFAFGFTLFTCTSIQQENLAIQESLIGTKWVAVANSADTIEFMNNECCFITLKNPMASNTAAMHIFYTVQAGKIIIGNNLLWYELRGDMLYYAGYSPYKKL